MKVFVSGQLNEKRKIQSVYEKLKEKGLMITHDWTRTDDLFDKFSNRKESGDRAAKDIIGVAECDIYILISDNRIAGKGMYVELGAALALKAQRNSPDIYIVGPLNHLSIFYLHPHVQHFQTLDELLGHIAQFNKIEEEVLLEAV